MLIFQCFILRSSRSQMLFKLVFLNISQNSQERTCARVLLTKVTGLQLYKKKKLAQVLNFEIFLKNTFL